MVICYTGIENEYTDLFLFPPLLPNRSPQVSSLVLLPALFPSLPGISLALTPLRLWVSYSVQRHVTPFVFQSPFKAFILCWGTAD